MESKAQFGSEQRDILQPARERSTLPNQAVCGLQRSYSRLSDLGSLRAYFYPHIQWRPDLTGFVS